MPQASPSSAIRDKYLSCSLLDFAPLPPVWYLVGIGTHCFIKWLNQDKSGLELQLEMLRFFYCNNISLTEPAPENRMYHSENAFFEMALFSNYFYVLVFLMNAQKPAAALQF